MFNLLVFRITGVCIVLSRYIRTRHGQQKPRINFDLRQDDRVTASGNIKIRVTKRNSNSDPHIKFNFVLLTINVFIKSTICIYKLNWFVFTLNFTRITRIKLHSSKMLRQASSIWALRSKLPLTHAPQNAENKRNCCIMYTDWHQLSNFKLDCI